MNADEDAPHSADYFGDYRDHWWNRDYLALLARLWDVPATARVLDVGSGLGHWTSTLAAVLPDEAHFVGVDPEPEWTSRAGERLSSPKFEFRTATAYELPFEEGRFDVVSCQTLLIHLAEPERALEEMLRVVRPGGLLLAAEPSNRADFFVGDSLTASRDPDEETRRARFYILCERGKLTLGEGDSSFGDVLPGALASVGAEEVSVRISDRAIAMVPPYESPGAQAMIEQLDDWLRSGVYIWDQETARRYYVAGGGAVDDFTKSGGSSGACRPKSAMRSKQAASPAPEAR